MNKTLARLKKATNLPLLQAYLATKRKQPRLLGLAIELTNDCNMKCPYCYGQERRVGYMDYSLFNSFIDQVPRYTMVSLGYAGESILHPQFSRFLKRAQDCHFRELRVNSNGVLAYPRGIKVIVNPKPPKTIFTHDFKIASGYVPPLEYPPYCRELFRYMAILWNGDFTVCCHDLAGRNVMGNLDNYRTLNDAWRSQQYDWLRYSIGYCGNCDLWKYKNAAMYDMTVTKPA